MLLIKYNNVKIIVFLIQFSFWINCERLFNFEQCKNEVICLDKHKSYDGVDFSSFNNLQNENLSIVSISKSDFQKESILKLLNSTNIKIFETKSLKFMKTCHHIDIFDYSQIPEDYFNFDEIIIPNLFVDSKKHNKKLNNCLISQQNLTEIKCDNKSITFLNIDIYNNVENYLFLTNIRYLSLKKNLIHVLRINNTNLLRYASNLVHIDLQDNKITTIDCNVFSAARSLRIIEYSNIPIDLKCIFSFNRNIIMQKKDNETIFNNCKYHNNNNNNEMIISVRKLHLTCDSQQFTCDVNMNTSSKLYELEHKNSTVRIVKLSETYNNLSLYIPNSLGVNYIQLQDVELYFNCFTKSYDIFWIQNYESYRIDSIIYGKKYITNSREHIADSNYANCFLNHLEKSNVNCDGLEIKDMIIDDSFVDDIRWLSLKNNKITSLGPNNVTPIPMLIFLDLSHNPLKHISKVFVINFFNLRRINFIEVINKNITEIIHFNNALQMIVYGHNGNSYVFNRCTDVEIISEHKTRTRKQKKKMISTTEKMEYTESLTKSTIDSEDNLLVTESENINEVTNIITESISDNDLIEEIGYTNGEISTIDEMTETTEIKDKSFMKYVDDQSGEKSSDSKIGFNLVTFSLIIFLNYLIF